MKAEKIKYYILWNGSATGATLYKNIGGINGKWFYRTQHCKDWMPKYMGVVGSDIWKKHKKHMMETFEEIK